MTKPEHVKPLRAAVAIGIGLFCAALVMYARLVQGIRPSDFALVHGAASVWWSGLNPYNIIGPGRPFEWPYLLLYPFTAVLVALPFASLPRVWADVLFVALGTGGMAWVAWNRPPLWWAYVSASMHVALATSQWAPALVFAAFHPSLGFLFTAKPSVGAAVWVAYPSRKALIGGVLFGAVTVILMPSWPGDWLTCLERNSSHLTMPLSAWGGPLLLLSWLRWRLPEARLLGAMAFVPQTPVPYDGILLFLIPRTHRQGVLLAVASWGVYAGEVFDLAPPRQTIVWFLYLPCLLFLLTDPRARVQRSQEGVGLSQATRATTTETE